MNIVFMGTPDYAVNTLNALIIAGHNIKAVFSMPDKPVGRKHILTAPPIKTCAIKHNLKVFQPTTLKDGQAERIIKEINPDIIVVVAYGKILPESILNIPKYGCVNGHASLLPKYRGASPIQWSIVCGETETGITTMLMDKGCDTGDILMQEKVKIGDDETAEQLFERLSEISASLMVETIDELSKGIIIPKKQEGKATYAPIITKEMAHLDFNKTSKEVYNAIRGYYSWPCAHFFINGKRIKVLSAKLGENTNNSPGVIFTNGDKLYVACKGGESVEIIKLQQEGSKPMLAKQFLCGNTISGEAM